MAEKIEKIEDFKFKPTQVASRELTRKFGRDEDFAELHILSLNDQTLQSNLNFTSYNFPPEGIDTEGLFNEINMDPVTELGKYGYISGKYKIKLNLLRRKILNTSSLLFFINEISPSRTELKLKINTLHNNSQTISSVRNFINEVESNIFFKDFGLNFNKGNINTAINIALDERNIDPEILIKLLNPLPPNFIVNDELNIVEEIIDPTVLTIDLGILQSEDSSIALRGPNFKIDTRLNSSIPSSFKTYDSILNNGSILSSSYNQLLNRLENREIPEIPYDYIRPISESLEPEDRPYHFENFVNFSSAEERLKNFEYKIKLVELYDSQLNDIGTITGNTSASSFVLNDKTSINNKRDNLLKGLDGYERFLYYTSGAFAYPKTNITAPFNLYPVSSSEVKTWLGSEESSNSFYGGQLLSASLYDRENQNNLERLVPNHILDNKDNEQYKLFINMVGQHFDQVWVHIKHLTEINDTHHTKGISKDLVVFTLKSLGIEAFDQFENSNLIEYILGTGTSGSAYYDVPTNQTLVTASNAGSIAKKDISKEIWKRLYHNAPHLLKTKGTERGLRALMSCYGIPSTLLNVKEYGGSTSDKTTYQTFTYEKSGLALQGNSGANGYFIKTNYSNNSNKIGVDSSLTTSTSSIVDFLEENLVGSTIQFRAKPHRTNNTQILLTLSGSTLDGVYDPSRDHIVTLEPYSSTANDISSSGDAIQYGRLNLTIDELTTSTDYFPIYNGDFWNINLSAEYKGTSETASLSIGARQANFNKNVFKYEASVDVSASGFWNSTWEYKDQDNGFKHIYIGGLESNSAGSGYSLFGSYEYSGSIQEVRYYIGEVLSDDTLTKHALEPFMYAGNTISSSFDNITTRLPLGSNDQQDSSSFHPNIDANFLNINSNPELVLNGNMEDNDGWVAAGSAINVGQSSTYANGGNYSYTYTTTSPNDGILYFLDSNNLELGQLYEISWDIFVDDTPGFTSTYNQITMVGFQSTAVSANTYLNGNALVENEWVTSKRIFEHISQTGTPYLAINNGSAYEGDRTYYVDNVSLKKISNGLKSNMSTQKWEEVVENHYHPTPDTVGISMTSEKVRIDEGTIDDDLLSTTIKSETSTLDRQPQDFEDLGVFFSPTTEINEDIVYQLGAFRLDDYIGSPLPSAQTASNYEDLKEIRDLYFKRYKSNRYNSFDYIKLIQYIDHTLFKIIEQWVPMKTNLKTGLLIEPSYLERSKFPRELPTIDYGTTMTQGSYQTFDFQIDPEKAFSLTGSSVITTNNLTNATGSDGQRQEQGTNFTIDISSHILGQKHLTAQGPIIPFNSLNQVTYGINIANTSLITSLGGGATINSPNKVTFTADGGTDKIESIAIGLISGKVYKASATISGYSATTNKAIGFDSQGGIPSIVGTTKIKSDGKIEFTFTADGDDIVLFAADQVGGVVSDILIAEELLGQKTVSTSANFRNSDILLGNINVAKKSRRYYRDYELPGENFGEGYNPFDTQTP